MVMPDEHGVYKLASDEIVIWEDDQIIFLKTRSVTAGPVIELTEDEAIEVANVLSMLARRIEQASGSKGPPG
jgi:hypothetical protein